MVDHRRMAEIVLLLVGMLMGVSILSAGSVLADDTGQVQAVPGYHPGLFTNGQKTASIPAAVNTYNPDEFSDLQVPAQLISYSLIPGDEKSGKKATLIGFLSGGNLTSPVYIFGRYGAPEKLQFLTTVLPDKQGIFSWEIPDNYLKMQEFQLKTI